MKRILQFIKNWTLPISMIIGVLAYFGIESLGLSEMASSATYTIISHWIQPFLIFMMLFLSFIKVDPHDMRPHRWHLWVLICQLGAFVVFSLMAMACDGESHGLKVLFEGAMLCFICPTATASAVITGRLGGSLSGVTTYLLIINLMVSLMAPAFLTMVEPHEGLDFVSSFFMIMGKVFPLLICPLVVAWMVRYLLPRLHGWLINFTGLAFYLWAVGLALAILVTVRSIALSTVNIWYMVGLAVISLICCVVQFAVGKSIGTRYDHESRITAGQAFGQKNTVFAIWLGLVFLDPVTTVVGGFYSVWHNIINSYQLYKARK